VLVALSGHHHHNKKRDRVHILEAFAIFCRRLCYPNQWWRELHKEFGRSTSVLSRIFGMMLHSIVSRFGPKVIFYPLDQSCYDKYLQCFVRNKGADPELRIVAVMNDKKLMTCRPTHFQSSQYDWDKKGHGLKFQTLEGPDGLLGFSCAKAFDGRRGDWRTSGTTIQSQVTIESWPTPHIQQQTGLRHYSSACLVRNWLRIDMHSMLPTVLCKPVLSGDTRR
jgi:hypothetical protein